MNEYVTARDPVNPNGYHILGTSYVYAGRWDDAIAALETALRLSPGHIATHYGIGLALLFKGEPGAALTAMQQESHEGFRLIGLVMAHYALGDQAASDAVLKELIDKYEQDAAYNIAYVLAFRNEADRAYEWLDKAVEYVDPGLTDIISEPAFGNIQSDPRWLPFLESIGMSPAQLDAIEFKVTLPWGWAGPSLALDNVRLWSLWVGRVFSGPPGQVPLSALKQLWINCGFKCS